jgi:hypothetical protein
VAALILRGGDTSKPEYLENRRPGTSRTVRQSPRPEQASPTVKSVLRCGPATVENGPPQECETRPDRFEHCETEHDADSGGHRRVITVLGGHRAVPEQQRECHECQSHRGGGNKPTFDQTSQSDHDSDASDRDLHAVVAGLDGDRCGELRDSPKALSQRLSTPGVPLGLWASRAGAARPRGLLLAGRWGRRSARADRSDHRRER